MTNQRLKRNPEHRFFLKTISMGVVLLVLAVCNPVFAETINLPVHGTGIALQKNAEVFPMPDEEVSFEEILAQPQLFQPWDDKWLISAPPMWLRLSVHAPANADKDWVLRIKRRFFEQLDVIIPDTQTGGYLNFSNGAQRYTQSEIAAQDYIYRFQIIPGDTVSIFIRVETMQNSLKSLDVSVQDLVAFESSKVTNMWAFGLYFGAMIALVFYNLILYLNLRTPGHRMYVLAMGSVLLFMGMDSGLLHNMLPDAIAVREPALFAALNSLMSAAMLRFCQVFCSLSVTTPRVNQWMWLLISANLAIALIITVVPLPWVTQIAQLAQLLTSLVVITLLVASVLAGIRGRVSGYVFLAAWSAFLIGGVLRTLLSLNLVPRIPATEYALYTGSVMEAMILALGLSYRVGQLRIQRNKAIREQQHAMKLANKDDLTPAYNRRFFDSYLTQIVTSPSEERSSTSLLLIDIDHFKRINDSLGHDAGDVMLKTITERCLHTIREGDVLCRIGGDEFAIVLHEVEPSAAVQKAKQVQHHIEKDPIPYSGKNMAITVSVGVMTDLSQVHTVGDALRHADRALYQAKAAGRNQVVVYS